VQLVSVPSGSLTVNESLQVAVVMAHCCVCWLHSAPVAQSAFTVQLVLQSFVVASQA